MTVGGGTTRVTSNPASPIITGITAITAVAAILVTGRESSTPRREGHATTSLLSLSLIVA